MFANDADVLSYLPDESVGSRPVDRTFAYKIACSKHPNYMQGVIDHARQMRMIPKAPRANYVEIVICQEYMDLLLCKPY